MHFVNFVHFYQIQNHHSFCLHILALLETFSALNLFRILFWYWLVLLCFFVRIGFEVFRKKPNKNEKRMITKGKERRKKNYKTNNCCSVTACRKRERERNEMKWTEKENQKLKEKKERKRIGFSLYFFFIFNSSQSFESWGSVYEMGKKWLYRSKEPANRQANTLTMITTECNDNDKRTENSIEKRTKRRNQTECSTHFQCETLYLFYISQ